MPLHDHFSTICDAARDLHVNQTKSRVFNALDIGTEEPTSAWSEAWKMLSAATKALLNPLLDLIRSIAWETLYLIKEVPNYLRSLLNMIAELLVNPVSSLATTFYTTAKRFWTFLIQLVPTAASFLPEIESFGKIIRQVGSSFINSAKFLLRGVAQVVSAVIGVYIRAAERLATFCYEFQKTVTSIPTMGLKPFQQLYEKSLQTVLFSVLMIQNVTKWAATKTDDAKRYLDEYAEKILNGNRSLQSLIARLDMTGFLKDALSSLLESEYIQKLIDYIGSLSIVVILRDIFNFIGRIIGNISFAVSTFVNVFVAGVLDIYMNIATSLTSEFGVEQKRLVQMTEACVKLQENSRVSPENKAVLKQVVQESQKTQKILEHTNVMTVTETWDVAHTLTNLYSGNNVAEEDISAAIKAQTGLGTDDLSIIMFNLNELLSTQLAVTFAQMSSSSKTTKIDGEYEERTLEENRQRLEEIPVKIRDIEKKIKEIQRNPNYIRLERARADKLEDLIDSDTDIDSSRINNIDRTTAAIEKQFRIDKLRDEIDELKKEAQDIEAHVIGKKYRIRMRTVLSTGGSLLVALSLGIFWIAKNAADSNLEFYLLQGKDLLKRFIDDHANDEVIRFQVNDFLASKQRNLDDKEATIDDFHYYRQKERLDMLGNRMPLAKVLAYSDLFKKMLISKQAYFVPETPKPAESKAVVLVQKGTDLSDPTMVIGNVGVLLDLHTNWAVSTAQLAKNALKPSWIAEKASEVLSCFGFGAKGSGMSGADSKETGAESRLMTEKGWGPHIAQQWLFWGTQLHLYSGMLQFAAIIVYSVCAAIVHWLEGEITEAGTILTSGFAQIFLVYATTEMKYVENTYLIGLLRMPWLQPLVYAYKLAMVIYPWLDPRFWLNKIQEFGKAVLEKIKAVGNGIYTVVSGPLTLVLAIVNGIVSFVQFIWNGIKVRAEKWPFNKGKVVVDTQTIQVEGAKRVKERISTQDEINRAAIEQLFKPTRKTRKLESNIPCDTCLYPESVWATASFPHVFYCSHGCATIAHFAPQ